MKKRWTMCVPALLAVFLAVLPRIDARAAERSKEVQPVAVLSFASPDELLGDFLYLTEAAGSADVGRLMTLLASPYMATMDKSKPGGVYLVMDGEKKVAAVAFLPINDLDTLLAVLKEQIGEPEELDDGVLEISTARRQPMFVKQDGAWVYMSNKRELLGNLPKNPVKLLGGLNEKYTIAVQANVDNIPESLRRTAVDGLRKGFEENWAENLRDERAEALARKIGERWLDELVRLINETEKITLGWEIDAQSKTTHIDISMTAVDGSKLAGELDAVKDSRSAFAGFLLPEAAATFHIAGKSAESDVEMTLLLLQTLHDEAMKGIDKDDDLKNDQERETVKDIVERFLDIAKRTVKARTVNGGGVLTLKPNAIAAAVGGFVADGDGLETAIRDLWEFAKEKDPETPDLKFQTQTYGAVKLHTTHVPLDDAEEQARQLLGDPMDVTLGIGAEAVYVAFGKDSADLLKQVIDRSLENTAQKYTPVEAAIALKPIFEFAATIEDDPGVKAALESLRQADGGDHISLRVMPIRRGISLRLEVGEAVLKAGGQAGKALRPLRGVRNRKPQPKRDQRGLRLLE